MGNSYLTEYKQPRILLQTYIGLDYIPTNKLLKSIKKARIDRKAGKASPIFSTVKEMKEWFKMH